MYKLYTDKNELFECEVSVKNASLKNSKARLIIESEDLNLVFNGEIKDGKCQVPIRKLNGILQENTKGKMSLEIIVENTYFIPWESNFTVEEHTSIKVQVKEQTSSKKPLVEIKMKEEKEEKVSTPPNLSKVAINEVSVICERLGITKSNVKDKRSDFIQILREYFKSNPEFTQYRKEIVATYLCS